MTKAIAIDTGGTFTDLVVYDRATGVYQSAKGLTTYDDLVGGIKDCCRKAGLDIGEVDSARFGTTLVINTLLQRNGAVTGLVTTQGFRDVLELGRGNRPHPYDLRYRRNPPLASRDRTFEFAERMSANGEALVEPLAQDIAALADRIRIDHPDIEALAVCLLNAYRNSAHERAVAKGLAELLPGVHVTAATELTVEWQEYERTSTAVANAYVMPALDQYLSLLEKWLGQEGYTRPYFLMASHGGAYSSDRARAEPVMLVESGPVGGCIGAARFAEQLDLDRVIAFDMGGTTAKCAVVKNGRFDVQPTYYVGGNAFGFPIRGGVLDIVEVGAGGGSIAAVDAEGRLSVGPQSAGSQPGPACYGRGGAAPTMTDANLILGRIDADLVGGSMKLDMDCAIRAINNDIADPLGLHGPDRTDEAARGILEIGLLHMSDAIKQITIQRGQDPRDFILVVYGGGGPLHAADLADELAIRKILVPPEPGTFSSLGMLMADARLTRQEMLILPINDAAMIEVRARVEAMQRSLIDAMAAEIGPGPVRFEHHADLKYKGQGHSIRVEIGAAAEPGDIGRRFDAVHKERFGYLSEGAPIEFVQLVVTGVLEMEKPSFKKVPAGAASLRPVGRRSIYYRTTGRREADIYRREDLGPGSVITGPAVIVEYGTSTIIRPGDRLETGQYGEMYISVAGK